MIRKGDIVKININKLNSEGLTRKDLQFILENPDKYHEVIFVGDVDESYPYYIELNGKGSEVGFNKDELILVERGSKISLSGLEEIFIKAKELDKNYIGVAFKLPESNSFEVIINSKENFDYKLNYYKDTYSHDLSHKHVDGLQIVGFAYGDTFQEIQNKLL